MRFPVLSNKFSFTPSSSKISSLKMQKFFFNRDNAILKQFKGVFKIALNMYLC